MLRIRYSSWFKKDFKAIVKRGYDVKLLELEIMLGIGNVISLLTGC